MYTNHFEEKTEIHWTRSDMRDDRKSNPVRKTKLNLIFFDLTNPKILSGINHILNATISINVILQFIFYRLILYNHQECGVKFADLSWVSTFVESSRNFAVHFGSTNHLPLLLQRCDKQLCLLQLNAGEENLTESKQLCWLSRSNIWWYDFFMTM